MGSLFLIASVALLFPNASGGVSHRPISGDRCSLLLRQPDTVAAVSKEGRRYLWLADVGIRHRKESPVREVIRDYRSVVLATVPVEMHELTEIVDELKTGHISVGALKDIDAGGSFEDQVYHVPGGSGSPPRIVRHNNAFCIK